MLVYGGRSFSSNTYQAEILRRPGVCVDGQLTDELLERYVRVVLVQELSGLVDPYDVRDVGIH